MLRSLLFAALLFSAVPALAVDPRVGELVFLRDGATVWRGKHKVDQKLIRFPAAVEGTKGKYLWLGRAWAKPDDVMSCDEALACYSQRVAVEPRCAEARANRGSVLLTLGDAAAALDDFNFAVTCEPGNPVWLVRRGDALTALGLCDEALRDYREAANVTPQWPTALVSLGDALLQCNEIAEAQGVYLKACKLDRHDPQAYFAYGNASLALGEYSGAVKAYTWSLKIDPYLAAARLNRGEAWRSVGKLKYATTDYTNALKYNPHIGVAHLMRGQVLNERRQYQRAATDFADAVRLEPHNAEAQKQLALFYATCQDVRYRNPVKAIQHASIACDLTTHADPGALSILAAAYAEAGDSKRAVEYQLQAAAAAEASASPRPAAKPVIRSSDDPTFEELPPPLDVEDADAPLLEIPELSGVSAATRR